MGSTDPANKFYKGSSWTDAFIVTENSAYAPPIAGTHYIARTSTLVIQPAGTTTFRTTFTLPVGSSGFSLSIAVHADNAASIRLNGQSAGGHTSLSSPSNFQGSPETFVVGNASYFVIGTNVLEIDLTNQLSDFGMPTVSALDYQATVQFYCTSGTYQYGRCMKKVTYVVVGPKGWPTMQIPQSDSTTRVAVLGSGDFGMETIESGSVAFAGTLALPGDAVFADVNGDGMRDRVFSFYTRSLKLPTGDSEACVTGTAEKVPFEGCGTVTVVS